jgi:hypothetical protein
MTKHATKIITNPQDVPLGYVPVGRFRESTTRNWKTIAKALSDAHQGGTIRAVKLVRGLGDLKTGPVFLHEGDTEAFLAERYPDAEPQATPAAPSAEATGELMEAIVRLTDAVRDLTAAMQLRAEVAVEEAVA